MRHGVEAYFHEIESFRRRLTVIGLAVAVLFLGSEWIAHRPAIVEALNDPKRFGFEGPDQYVRHIMLETTANEERVGWNRETIVPVEMHAGGGKEQPAAHGQRPVPHVPGIGHGEGDDANDLQSRLRALALEGPVVRSEDLVVERLVRPEYPEEARDKNIEGTVEMVALVDTLGVVTEVHIVGGSRQPVLEQAATNAVLQCRYRPYRVKENLEQVWAYYRIAFSLY